MLKSLAAFVLVTATNSFSSIFPVHWRVPKNRLNTTRWIKIGTFRHWPVTWWMTYRNIRVTWLPEKFKLYWSLLNVLSGRNSADFKGSMCNISISSGYISDCSVFHSPSRSEACQRTTEAWTAKHRYLVCFFVGLKMQAVSLIMKLATSMLHIL